MQRSLTDTAKARRGRPSKLGQSFPDTRAALLKEGLRALTEKGFSATGIDEVLRAVGVPKGSFYHYFPSKEAFGTELISMYASYFAAKIDRHLKNDLLSPVNRLKAFVLDAESGMHRYEFRRGCLIGNLGQEMGALPESFRRQITDVFLDWQRRTSDCLKLAQQQGEIASDRDPDEIASFFWIGWEGAVLRAKLERSAQPLKTFAQQFFRSLAP
jgi:TetR/AcrR family transcriptional repressor of nem operon